MEVNTVEKDSIGELQDPAQKPIQTKALFKEALAQAIAGPRAEM
jgi:hypothetical protein